MELRDKTPVPEGYMRDGRGRLVPNPMVKPIDKLRDEVVNGIFGRCVEMNEALETFKRVVLNEILTFCELSAEQYGASIGGVKGNIQLTSFDGSIKIQVAVNESIDFGEQIIAAKALIDDCLADWTANGPDEVKVLVQDAFDSKDGRLSSKKIMGLRKFNFDDPRWKQAMEAISDAVIVVGSKNYLRVYHRNEDNGKMEALAMDGGNL